MAAKKSLLPAALRKNKQVAKFDQALLRGLYRIQARYLQNPASEKYFRAAPPVLTPAQQRVVKDLEKQGLAMISFDEFFGDDALWQDISGQMNRFVANAETNGDQQSLSKSGIKDYLLRRVGAGHGETLPSDDPLVRIGLKFVDIVNTYLGLWSKLTYMDQWYTRVSDSEGDRVASQRWHRDPEDEKLVKVFMYFSDVDEESGPFEYVPGSAKGGAFESHWPWTPGHAVYPEPKAFQEKIPTEHWKSCTGKTGTIIFCNSSGFHRGGFARSKARVMAVWSFVSPASLASYNLRRFEITGLDTKALSKAQQFALS